MPFSPSLNIFVILKPIILTFFSYLGISCSLMFERMWNAQNYFLACQFFILALNHFDIVVNKITFTSFSYLGMFEWMWNALFFFTYLSLSSLLLDNSYLMCNSSVTLCNKSNNILGHQDCQECGESFQGINSKRALAIHMKIHNKVVNVLQSKF